MGKRLVILFLLPVLLSAQQPSQTQRYKIVQIPAQIENARPGIKQRINKEIASASDKRRLFSILNDSLKTFKNLPVKIREQIDESSFKYYTYLIEAPAESSLKFVDIKGSRGNESERIYQKIQLKKFFTDTVVIIDTLRLDIFPKDFNYRIDGYYLSIPSVSNTEISLPADGNNTLIIPGISITQNFISAIPCTLYNKADTDKPVGVFFIKSLTKEEKETLNEISGLLKEENRNNPGYNNQRITEHLLAYIRSVWGNASRANVLAWLKKN